METKISLNQFLKSNDKLVTAYCFFLGLLAFTVNINDTNIKIDFSTYFLILSFLCWTIPVIKSLRDLYNLKWDLLLYILFTSVGNFTIAKSLFASFDFVLVFSKLLYVIASSFLMLSFYFGIRLKKPLLKKHKFYFIITVLFTLIFISIWVLHRLYFVMPFIEQGGGS